MMTSGTGHIIKIKNFIKIHIYYILVSFISRNDIRYVQVRTQVGTYRYVPEQQEAIDEHIDLFASSCACW